MNTKNQVNKYIKVNAHCCILKPLLLLVSSVSCAASSLDQELKAPEKVSHSYNRTFWLRRGSLVSMFNTLYNTKHRCQNVKPIDDFSWVLNSFSQNSYIMLLLINQWVSSPKEGTSQCTEWLQSAVLTSHLMKTMERLLLPFLRPQVHHALDPLQFDYQEKAGLDNSILYLLHRPYSHLEKRNSAVRIMFFFFFIIIPVPPTPSYCPSYGETSRQRSEWPGSWTTSQGDHIMSDLVTAPHSLELSFSSLGCSVKRDAKWLTRLALWMERSCVH